MWFRHSPRRACHGRDIARPLAARLAPAARKASIPSKASDRKTVSVSSADSQGAFAAATGDIVSTFASAAELAVQSAHGSFDLQQLAASIGHTQHWNGPRPAAWGVWQNTAAGDTCVNTDTNGVAIDCMAMRIASVEATPATGSYATRRSSDGIGLP
jgi:hypothetical protein